jgi:glutathione S-transferase
MPVDPQASVRISAFKWVPPFAQGHVRDLRARWALEEAGVPYAVRKLDAAVERPADYFEEQPFGQVPSYRDDTVSLFESGAIVLHVGRNCEALVPTDPAAQARDGVADRGAQQRRAVRDAARDDRHFLRR